MKLYTSFGAGIYCRKPVMEMKQILVCVAAALLIPEAIGFHQKKRSHDDRRPWKHYNI